MLGLKPKLLQFLQPHQISDRELDRLSYARDCNISSLIKMRDFVVEKKPTLILWPENTEQLSQILKVLNEAEISSIPFGAGSGVCGGTLFLKEGVCIDLKRFQKIISIDPENLEARVQTGILGEILERELQDRGFTLGHFPSSIYGSTLGGYLACRSAGQLSTKYGKIEDRVEALELCLADGQIFQIGNDQPLDLKELFLGSEGVLGLMTEATLRIAPKPEAQAFRAFSFSNIYEGMAAVRHFMQAGFRPAVVRLYDPLDSWIFFKKGKGKNTKSQASSLHPVLELIKKKTHQTLFSYPQALNRILDWSLHRVLLILGFEGASWRVELENEEVKKICLKGGGKDLGEEPGWRWLKKRYSVSYKMSPLIYQGCFADTFEVAAPWSKIETLYHEMRKALAPYALVMAHLSHFYSDGACIYFTFAGRAEDMNASLALHHQVWAQALKTCHQCGATVSHHHGVGMLKAEGFVQEMGTLMNYLRASKAFFDPKNLLNPGKLGLPL